MADFEKNNNEEVEEIGEIIYTLTDEETGEITTIYYEYQVRVPYDYYILYVYLASEDMADLAEDLLTREQMEAYLVYVQTKGNRPTLFS